MLTQISGEADVQAIFLGMAELAMDTVQADSAFRILQLERLAAYR